MFKKGVPECFQRKVLVDALVKAETEKDVVDFEEYVKLKEQQSLTFYSCEKLISFLKKGK